MCCSRLIEARIERVEKHVKDVEKEEQDHRSALQFFRNLVPRIEHNADEPCVICLDDITNLTVRKCFIQSLLAFNISAADCFISFCFVLGHSVRSPVLSRLHRSLHRTATNVSNLSQTDCQQEPADRSRRAYHPPLKLPTFRSLAYNHQCLVV